MKALFFALSLSLALPAMAESPTIAPAKTAAGQELKLIHVADLEEMMTEQKASTFVYDANNEKVRTENGLIPGAKILASASKYDTQVLPADKAANLVFYCANTQCMASHEAAKRAKAQGYTNAMVMADGIQGWKKAGKPTEKFVAN